MPRTLKDSPDRNASAARLVQLAETLAGVGHWRLDLRTNKVEWSDQVYRIHGVDPESFDPNIDAAIDAYHPDDRAQVVAMLERARTTDEPYAATLRLRRLSDGEERIVSIRSAVETDPADGKTVAVFGVFQDITEQQSALERAETNERRYRLLSENATDVIAIYRPDSIFTYLSPSAYSLLGYRPEEMIGRSTYTIIDPRDQARVSREFAAYIQAGPNAPPTRIEYRGVHKDGRRIWVEAHPRALFDQNGQLIELHDVVRDISQRKEAEAKLEESERRYRLIAENATDLIVRMGPDGTILYCSPACRQLGFEPHELTGRNLLDGVHADEREKARTNLQALFAGEPVDIDAARQHRVRTKDGRWVWLEGAPSIVRDEHGKPVEVVNVLRDVTARIQMESDLRHAKVQADAAAAAKADFLATMSHEIRTPLTSVIGFSRLLNEMEGLTESARHFAGRISRASQSLLALINDILDYSKLEAGQVAIHRQPTQTRTFLSDIHDMFASQAAARGLELSLTVDQAAPAEINIDPDRLRQVLVNLIGNAVKFTETGRVDIDADWEPQSQAVIVSVRDTGAGIPEDKLVNLFKRFSQVDGTSTRKHGGTGLGLAICKGLVEAMGGKIGVDSVENEGSRFWFVMPAGLGLTDDFTPSDIRFDADARILVVDDHEPNRALVRTLLVPYGVAVDEAVDGEMATAMAMSTPYAAIIMDMHMPTMNGQKAAQAIKKEGESRDAPILAFSGDRRVKATAESGFDGRLDKPISGAALLTALRDALSNRD